jgi:hypothetical protein
MIRALLIAVLLSGCGASSEPAASTSPSTSPRAPTPADADAAARGLAASIDPARGLVITAHLDDPSEGEAPPMITSGHRCSAAEIAEVAAMLSDYVSDRRSMDLGQDWTCSADRCELPGMMEFDPMRALRFGRDPQGNLVVVAVQFLGITGVTEEHERDVRAAAEIQLAELSGPCR